MGVLLRAVFQYSSFDKLRTSGVFVAPLVLSLSKSPS